MQVMLQKYIVIHDPGYSLNIHHGHIRLPALSKEPVPEIMRRNLAARIRPKALNSPGSKILPYPVRITPPAPFIRK